MSEFKGSFDYKTTEELVAHLREHAARVAGDGPGGSNYDPETLCLEDDAANEIERLLRIERLYGPMQNKAYDWQEIAQKRHDEIVSFRESGTVDQRFLLHLVDIVWGDAMEDGQVPSTEHALRLIKRARQTFDAASE